MHQKTLFLVVAMALVAAPQFALADGDGAVTGVVGGAVAGAVIIALFQVVALAFVPYTVATGGLYVALLVILFFRPQGLFGERIQRRV